MRPLKIRVHRFIPNRSKRVSWQTAVIFWVVCALMGAAFALFQEYRKSQALKPDVPSGLEAQIRQLGVGVYVWQAPAVSCDCPERNHGRSWSPRRRWSRDERLRHYTSIARQAATTFDTAYIKVADGVQPFRLYYDELIDAYTAAGVQVVVWSYNYCNRPRQEAELIHSYLHRKGVVGYIANTENHVKNKSRAVEAMMQRAIELRDNCNECRTKLVGYAPFALLDFHKTLDYAVLNRYSEYVAPQVYWADMGLTPKQAVDKMYVQWSRWEKAEELAGRSRAIPLCPIGQLYGRVKPGQIMEFMKLTRGYYSIAFWDQQHAAPWMIEEVRAGKAKYRQ